MTKWTRKLELETLHEKRVRREQEENEQKAKPHIPLLIHLRGSEIDPYMLKAWIEDGCPLPQELP